MHDGPVTADGVPPAPSRRAPRRGRGRHRHRTPGAAAEAALGTSTTAFPGGHGAFMSDVEPFASRLRQALT